MEDLANIENEEKQLITSFSNGQSPSGGDFQKLIEYINGQTIDCSLSAIQPIELGSSPVQKYNLIKLPKKEISAPAFTYNKTSIYLLTIGLLLEGSYISKSYKVTTGNFYLLADGKFSEEASVPSLADRVTLNSNSAGDQTVITINVSSDIDMNIYLEFKYLK